MTTLWDLKRLAQPILGLTVILSMSVSAAGPPYDLSHTDGMNCFAGSAEAEKLLEQQGFVVADPQCRQIFEPYIESPLPVFVTPDTAWHTYHILLEEGVKELERVQSGRLIEFSRRLLEAARQQPTNVIPEFSTLADYASIGLALQDRAYRETLATNQKQLVAALSTGSSPVNSPIGFPLSPVQFRPQSFYSETPELADFYAAHQWYACVNFRLSDDRETLLAMLLSWLIQSNSRLQRLWKQLTEPYDTFVALPEDGTVSSYGLTARTTLGTEFTPSGVRARVSELRKRLDIALQAPRISDQSLTPAQYATFGNLAKGFRLLPARQLPCSACFQDTVDPKIPGRMCPSGLDFMVASEVMRSPAAIRALQNQYGEPVLKAVQTVNCPAMPATLYGQSMALLAKLQEPLPTSAPEPLRTKAWGDLQLWMQLGAWSEQRHTWALYSKMGALTSGIKTPPPGVVAPYPAFFAGLGKMANDTALAFENCEADQRFEAKSLAKELYAMEKLVQNNYNGMTQQELARIRPQTDHFSRFIRLFYSAHTSEMVNDARGLHSKLDNMLNRVSETGLANAEETETLKMYYETRLFAPPVLRKLAEVCEQLAKLAKKQLAGETLGHDEVQWLKNYGQTIAELQGYVTDTYPDEFPIISRIFHEQSGHSIFYAGVARPQTLYMVLPYKGKLQLYRGAVLSYREFERPEDQALDDNSWRDLIKQDKAPAPPPFTSSFLRTDAPNSNDKRNVARGTGLISGKPGDISLQVSEVSLGASPTEWVWHEGWITPSEDCRHVAYRARSGKKWQIFRDGVPGKEYDEAYYQRFSPDNEHLAFLAKEGDKWRVVLDGTEGEMFPKIVETTKHHWPFEFSPDSKRLGYVASVDNGNQCVVVDGKPGPVFDEVLNHSFSFSDNSKHFAYAGRRHGRGIVVRDGEELLEAEDVFSPVQSFGDSRVGDTFGPFLSPDGSRLACAIRRGAKWFLILDGVESQPWDSVSYLDLEGEAAGFSPDGRHFTYVGERGDKQFVVVDRTENPGTWLYCAVFSPDSQHSAFIRVIKKQNNGLATSLVVDGVAGKEFSGEIKQPLFSPDGKRLAYKVSERIGSEYFVIHGGEEFDDYSADRDIRFSPDSLHVAFLGEKQDRIFFVVDGHEYLKSDDFRDSGIRSSYFTFSPDSKRWGYISHHDGKDHAVISGEEYGTYDFISVPNEEAYIYFSPDSAHFAYMATSGRLSYLVVDGHNYELDGTSWLSGSVLRFDSPTKLHGLVMGKDRMSRLEVEIHSK